LIIIQQSLATYYCSFPLAECNETDREDFRCELELLLDLKRHENVVQLLGHCKSKITFCSHIYKTNCLKVVIDIHLFNLLRILLL